MSYYIVSPYRVGNGTFVFSPETSTVSGTKVMAKYIIVDRLIHHNPEIMMGMGEWDWWGTNS